MALGGVVCDTSSFQDLSRVILLGLQSTRLAISQATDPSTPPQQKTASSAVDDSEVSDDSTVDNDINLFFLQEVNVKINHRAMIHYQHEDEAMSANR